MSPSPTSPGVFFKVEQPRSRGLDWKVDPERKSFAARGGLGSAQRVCTGGSREQKLAPTVWPSEAAQTLGLQDCGRLKGRARVSRLAGRGRATGEKLCGQGRGQPRLGLLVLLGPIGAAFLC